MKTTGEPTSLPFLLHTAIPWQPFFVSHASGVTKPKNTEDPILKKTMTPISYKPIKPKADYCIFVSKLPLCEDEYRVSLFEENDPHDTQIFDLNLHRPTDRRKLEDYVRQISKQTHLKGVWFGNGDCIGDNHYPLAKYIEQNKTFPSKNYLNDIHLKNY